MFSAYAKVADNTYREVFGLDFEQFAVGQIFRHRPGITISQQDNTDEALDTINSAQLHYDQHYAEQTEWKHCLGVSTLTLQKVLGSSWKTFARKDRITVFENIAMVHPVFGGDTLYSETEILALDPLGNDECGELQLETRGLNQTGMIVTKVQYRIRVYKAGKHPYYGQSCFDYNLNNDKFSAYKIEDDGGFKEEVGIYFEDFNPGEIYEHAPSKVVTPEEATQHALRSLNWDPKHIDPAFYHQYFSTAYCAGQAPHCPITEIYFIGSAAACTARTFGRVVANLGWTNIVLHREVFPNERFTVKSEVMDKRESHSRPTQGIMQAKTACYDKNGREIMSYQRVFLIYKKGLGPYDKAGY